MKIKKTNFVSKTTLHLEEYIPLKIKFDTATEEYHPGFEFVKGDSSLLDLMFGEESQELFSITLVICNEFKILNTPLPVFEALDGNICIAEEILDSQTHFETDTFVTEVYSNGTIIKLSDNTAHCFYKNDDVIWGIDENDDICQLIVCMNSDSVAHLTNELQLQ